MTLNKPKIFRDIDNINASLGENVKKLNGVINVSEYGLIGDGSSHPLSASYSTLESAQVDYPAATALTDEKDWCAIQQAINIAMNIGYMSGKGATIMFPYCKAILNKQIISKNVSWDGNQGTEIHFQNFGNGTTEVSAIVFDNVVGFQRWSIIKNILITGDGGYYNKGVRGTYLNGVEIINNAIVIFDNVVTKYFNKGHIWNNSGGHIQYSNGSDVRENYYGIYCKQNRGDYRLCQSHVQKNNFANFATNASTGFTALVMRDGHCGFSPYAFYCEPEASNSNDGNQNLNLFLKDVQLDQVRFESIGNGAIYSDYTQTQNPLVSGLLIKNVGFTWGDSTYYISNLPKDYAIDLGLVDGVGVKIDSGSWKFTAGNVNTIRVRQLNSSFSLIGNETASAISVLSGTGIVQAGQTYTASRVDGMIVPASIGGSFCNLITNGTNVTYTPFFVNNSNKRFRFFVMCDFPGDCYGEFFTDGATIYPLGTIGSKIAYGATNPGTSLKLNIYLSSTGTIGIDNQLGSDRKVSITVEGFY